jgi:hypothetical protein
VIINDDFNNTYAKILVKEGNRLYAQVSVGLYLFSVVMVSHVNTKDIFKKKNSQKFPMP